METARATWYFCC